MDLVTTLQKYLCVMLLLIGVMMVSGAKAGGFGDFLGGVKETLGKAGEKVGSTVKNITRSEPSTTTAIDESANTTIKNLLDPSERLAKSYEGTLTVDDKICSQLVEPFELTSNVSGLFTSLTDTLSSVFQKGNGSLDKGEIQRELRLKAKKMNWLPMDQEIYYGKMKHEHRIKTDGTLIERSRRGRVKRLYAKADAMLNQALSDVTESHPYQFTLVLIGSEEINAEAIPGGYLYVNTE